MLLFYLECNFVVYFFIFCLLYNRNELLGLAGMVKITNPDVVPDSVGKNLSTSPSPTNSTKRFLY